MEIYTIVIIAILAVIIIRLWKNGNSWKNKFEELPPQDDQAFNDYLVLLGVLLALISL